MMELAGYRAACERAAFLERPDRALIALTGDDRASYLQGLLTNDILALRPGTGCYAAYLTPQGRMIADMAVLDLGDRILLDAPARARERLVRRLEEFVITEEVQVADLGDLWSSVGVYGPASGSMIEAVATSSGSNRPAGGALPRIDAAREYDHVTVPFRETSVIVAATREAGVAGWVVYLPRARVPDLLEALGAAGGVPLEPAAFEILRVEAGRPAFGVDMDETTIPLEAGIEDRAISFTKGCYVGQELIVRILHRGQGRVARRLVGLVIDPGEDVAVSVPPRGATVSAGATEVGRVTSAVYSPRLGRPIALAVVPRDLAAPGTSLIVSDAGRARPARVVALPFVAS